MREDRSGHLDRFDDGAAVDDPLDTDLSEHPFRHGGASVDALNLTPDAAYTGTPGDDNLTGTSGSDSFDLSQGGNDTASGVGGDDTFTLGAALTPGDSLDGGTGIDTLIVNGDYAAGMTFGAAAIANIEKLQLTAGHSYKFILGAGNVGGAFTVDASALGSANSAYVDANVYATQTTFYGGQGDDTFVGGAQSVFHFENGGSDTGYVWDDHASVVFYMGAALSAGDRLIESYYSTDSKVVLDGDYSERTVITSSELQNIRTLQLIGGHSYQLVVGDDNLVHDSGDIATYPHGLFVVDGSQIGPQDSLQFDGRAETSGAFHITGGAGDDLIYDGGGNDVISTGGGNDNIFASDGNDTIDSGDGADFIVGGPGDDTINAGAGDDFIYTSYVYTSFGPAGVDTIDAGSGNDVVYLQKPNGGTIEGGDGLDAIVLIHLLDEAGRVGATIDLSNQTVTEGSGVEQLHGFEGAQGSYNDDMLIGDATANWLMGGGGNDVMEGGQGNDILFGDSFRGTWFDPSFDIVEDPDEIDAASFAHANRGETVIFGGSDYSRTTSFAIGGDGYDHMYGIDSAIGSPFNDYIVGTTNFFTNLYLKGGDGNDTLIGGTAAPFPGQVPGTRYLDGGNGDDVLVGGLGADTLIGGAGKDIMSGGAGGDTFVFKALGDLSLAADHITDFEAVIDTLDFSAIAGLTFIGTAAFTHVAGQMNYVAAGGTTTVQIDADGDGVADRLLVIDNGQFVLGETAAGSHILHSLDSVAPTLASGAFNEATQAVNLTFSEKVKAGTGFFELHKSDGTLVDRLAANSSWIHIDGNHVAFQPDIDLRLAPGTSYYALIDNGAITDLAGNAYAGVSSPSALAFTVPTDVTGPNLISMTPASGATFVPVNSNFVLTYDEALFAGPGTLEIWLLQPNGPVMFRSIDARDTSQVSISGNTVTLNPSVDLPNFREVFLIVNDGAFLDAAGNGALRVDTVSSNDFNTDRGPDGASPVLLSITPANNATAVPTDANIVLTFSEPVRPSLDGNYIADNLFNNEISFYNLDGSLFKSFAVLDSKQVTFSGNTVTINPGFDLPANTTFIVAVGIRAIEDMSGNYYDGARVAPTLTFTTNGLINGTDSNDVLPGTAGDDLFRGKGGNDAIDGGGGNDTAIYAGARSDYQITYDGASHRYTVVDLRPGSPDGTDTLANVEFAQFSDGTVGLSPAPALAGTGTAASYTEQGAAAAVAANLTVTDGGTTLAGATVAISAGFVSGDTLNFTNQNGIAGSYDTTTHILTLSGSASVANYQAALRSVTFSSPSDDPTAGGNLSRTITIVANDGSFASAPASATVNVTAVNDAPLVSGAGNSLGYTEQAAAIVLDGALALSDPDNTTLASAKVTISAGFVAGDTLNFVNQNGISGAYNAATHILTLTGVSSLANYQAALRSVTFFSNSDNPDNYGANPARTISWQVDDGAAANHLSTVAVTTLNITAVDDPASLHNDAFAIGEMDPLGLGRSLFADNGSGADVDPDTVLHITAVNGVAVNVGQQIALASGALLTINTDGTFAYDPNHAFDALAAVGSGATDVSATDTFNYTINGATVETASIAIAGLDSNDTLLGTAGNDVFDGGVGNDTVVFTGNRADYVITFDTSTLTYTVADQRPGAPDGSDTARHVENFRFADGTYASVTFVAVSGNVTTTWDAADNHHWASQAVSVDAQGSLAQQVIVNDNGTTWTNVFDSANAAAWAWTSSSFDTAGHLLLQVGTNDDGTHWLTLNDVAGQYAWATATVSYDAGWNVQSVSGTNDNGSHTVTMANIAAALDSALWFAAPYDPDFAGAPFDTVFTGGSATDMLYGHGGNDTLDGAGGNDVLNGGAGNDTLTGGAGDDRFVFRFGDGLDTITDFAPGNSSGDLIDLHGYGVTSFTALQAFMTQQGADTVIAFDGQNQILLHNVTMSALGSGDFVFS